MIARGARKTYFPVLTPLIISFAFLIQACWDLIYLLVSILDLIRGLGIILGMTIIVSIKEIRENPPKRLKDILRITIKVVLVYMGVYLIKEIGIITMSIWVR